MRDLSCAPWLKRRGQEETTTQKKNGNLESLKRKNLADSVCWTLENEAHRWRLIRNRCYDWHNDLIRDDGVRLEVYLGPMVVAPFRANFSSRERDKVERAVSGLMSRIVDTSKEEVLG